MATTIENQSTSVNLPSLDEYVIVQQPDDTHSAALPSLASDDDASYDYCDDVFSQHSCNDDDMDNFAESHVLKSSQTAKENFILSVPSGLMKELDDAHAAAKLAKPSSQSVEDHKVEDDIESLTKSTSMNVSGSRGKSKASNTASQANLSRSSNKKRRKKLKLMKKEQAAANAAKALSLRTAADTRASKSKKAAATSITSNRSSKKATNVAVLCARETLASYRNQVLCSSVT